MLEAVRDQVVDCGDGARLLLHLNEPRNAERSGTVVLIHGWEGSASSTYMLSAGSQLWSAGYRVARLNLRDHGDSHHLNRALFHSCRLDEVVGAVKWVQQEFPDSPLYLGGYSLGGNFALRVAARADAADLDIRRVVAICPVLNPEQTMEALDSGWAGYRMYFIHKWRRSLKLKRAAFPSDYDFSNLERFKTLESMTDYFVRHYTEYPDLLTYLRGYALAGDRLAGMRVPSEMLVAEDDPVIPVKGLEQLARPDSLRIRRSAFGGHCGFLENYRLRSLLDRYLVDALDAA
jgi:predicted alpha/beta-fold hydrolase